ncbi:MAG: AAA family ATPase [Hyphomicrobiales bacterium]
MNDQAEKIEPELEESQQFGTAGQESAQSGLGLVADIPRISIQAFCETDPVAQILQGAAQDRRFSKAHTNVQLGGINAATQWFSQAPTPNVLIVESRAMRDGMLEDLARLAEVCDETTKVVVIGHVNDVLLYRTLMSQGVSEYIVAPVTELQFIESISGLYSKPDATPVGRIFVFAGAKGGVGSSTLAHNVGWTISERLSDDVVITDLDLAYGTAGLNFNQDSTQGIAEALGAPDRLDEMLIDRLLTKCSERLSLLTAPGAIDRDFQIEEETLDIILDTIRHSVPTVIVDMPNVWAPWARQTLIKADEVVITATPEIASLRNTKNLIDMMKAERPNDSMPHLVLNMAAVPKRPEISAADFAKAIDIKPSIVIPYDPVTFGTATNNGQMVFEVSPKSKASDSIMELAKLVSGRSEAGKRGKFSLGPLLGKLTGKGKK